MQLTIGDLHELLGGELRFGAMPPHDGDATLVGHVNSDSREVQPDEVFWALVGPRYNGAHFAEEAFVRGAAGVVTSGRVVEPWAGRWSLCVPDTREALWELAAWSRGRFKAPLVAVTGSVGKTTARRMIDTVLGSRLSGAASPMNFNSHIGVPLSLTALEAWQQYAVLELGANGPGEIGRLAGLCRPRIGVITRIAEVHFGGFGSQPAVAQAKAELLASLPADGWAVLNGDDPSLRRMGEHCRAQIVWIGRGAENDVTATDVSSHDGLLRFQVDGQPFTVPVWGRHHLTSALAAIAVGRLFELDSDEIATALAGCHGVPMRCEVTHVAGATIVDDSYNVNPTAMRAALELLREIDAPGKRIVVCGDMGDLGDAAPTWHRRFGAEVVHLCGADLLIACGQHALHVTAAAREAGMPEMQVLTCQHWEEALPALNQALTTGDVVLVKGARTMGLERVVESIKTERLSAAA